MTETMTPDLDTKFMVDPYLNWVKAEGAPIHEGAALDLLSLDVKPWARFGMNGAVCHVEGRCDYLTAFLFALGAGQSSAHVRHTYEDVFYVLSGNGETQITLSDGHEITIEWGEKKNKLQYHLSSLNCLLQKDCYLLDCPLKCFEITN